MKPCLPFLLIIISFLGCKSGSNISSITSDAPCNNAFVLSKRSKALLNKRWSEINIRVLRHTSDTTELDVTDQFMVSDLDDLLIFHQDGTFVFDEGASKAREESDQIYGTGNWSLNDQTSSLSLCMDEDVTTYRIVKLKSEELVMHFDASKANELYTYVLTYRPL